MADQSQHLQPTPDLEPVRRLVERLQHPRDIGLGTLWKLGMGALPALNSLLAEVEKLREKNARMQAALDSIRDEADVKRLRAYDEIKAGHSPEYYRGVNDACNELRYFTSKLRTDITKAAEEGLSR